MKRFILVSLLICAPTLAFGALVNAAHWMGGSNYFYLIASDTSVRVGQNLIITITQGAQSGACEFLVMDQDLKLRDTSSARFSTLTETNALMDVKRGDVVTALLTATQPGIAMIGFTAFGENACTDESGGTTYTWAYGSGDVVSTTVLPLPNHLYLPTASTPAQ